MIKNISIAATQKDYKIDDKLVKYIHQKIGKLDKRMKRRNRQYARVDVKLKESTGKGGKKCTCEVIVHIPGFRLTASESTINMFAAIDIVEVKLQNQLKKHKEKHSLSRDKHQIKKARQAIGKIFSR